jgi:parallel beta-helix repeat protein
MALPAALIWEMRATGSADDNGGGFVVGGSGTDYSQQDSPQVSVTDAVTNSSTTVTSATANFTSLMVDNLVQITEGGQLRWFRVVTRNSATSITLDRATTSTGSGRTLKLGGAIKIASGGITFDGHLLPGHRVYGKGAFAQPSVNSPVLSSSGSIAQPIVFEGYSVTRGDGGRCTLTGNSTLPPLIVSGSNIVLKNIICDGIGFGNTCLTLSGNRIVADNCIAKSGTGTKILCSGASGRLFKCLADGNSQNGIPISVTGANWALEHSEARSTANQDGIVINTNGQTVIENCISRNNFAAGMYVPGSGGVTMRNNAFHGNANGVVFNNATDGMMNVTGRYNVFTSNSLHALWYFVGDVSTLTGSDALMKSNFIGNFFHGNGDNYFNLPVGTGDVALSVNPFVDPSNGDFTFNSTAGGGPTVVSTLSTFTFADGTNVGNYISGPLGSGGNTAPTAPSGLTATIISEGQIDLAWTDNSTDEIYFIVERSDNGGSYALLGATVGGDTSYSDLTVAPNVVYAYRVKAVN